MKTAADICRAILSKAKENMEDITINERIDTKYGTAITHKKIDVLKISKLKEILDQIEKGEI